MVTLSDPKIKHPAAIDLYGEDACQVYLEQMVSNPVSIEVLDAERIGIWDWEIDDRSTLTPSIYAVQVNRAVSDQTEEFEVHLALPGTIPCAGSRIAAISCSKCFTPSASTPGWEFTRPGVLLRKP